MALTCCVGDTKASMSFLHGMVSRKRCSLPSKCTESYYNKRQQERAITHPGACAQHHVLQHAWEAGSAVPCIWSGVYIYIYIGHVDRCLWSGVTLPRRRENKATQDPTQASTDRTERKLNSRWVHSLISSWSPDCYAEAWHHGCAPMTACHALVTTNPNASAAAVSV